ncbi:hypothetical protein ASF49_01865 [Methylobacterium sp. Leaf104]|uniref:DUF1178 family protein n=1 Tax=Methylobacterium TaxID=407 RepID=UPI000701B615|nr:MULTISPECIES: DUF1178 family protein [Methylobacterium]KQP42613.1 hypothetical protein ASF49_01865 [Methylobacterium sp. Leaf104]MCI9878830.1 DUF1178 family protein [Methylobacterium goesingense]
MIRYTLVCEARHGFESWFPSSDSFDAQAARGLVACPVCGSAQVGKSMMAPSVARTDRGNRAPPAPAEAASTASLPAVALQPIPQPMPQLVPTEPERRLRALMRALRAEATRNADDVGTRFPEEARRIHYGETEIRAIYGEASLEEARALVDEGIAVAPLPPASDDRH